MPLRGTLAAPDPPPNPSSPLPRNSLPSNNIPATSTNTTTFNPLSSSPGPTAAISRARPISPTSTSAARTTTSTSDTPMFLPKPKPRLHPHLRIPTPLRPHAFAIPSNTVNNKSLPPHLIAKYTPFESPSPSPSVQSLQQQQQHQQPSLLLSSSSLSSSSTVTTASSPATNNTAQNTPIPSPTQTPTPTRTSTPNSAQASASATSATATTTSKVLTTATSSTAALLKPLRTRPMSPSSTTATTPTSVPSSASSTTATKSSLPTLTSSSPDPHLRAFRQILDADSTLDFAKLRRAAASGVPPALRSTVWTLLLARPPPRRAYDLSLQTSRQTQYENLVASSHFHVDPALTRRVRRILSRHRTPFSPTRTDTLVKQDSASQRCSGSTALPPHPLPTRKTPSPVPQTPQVVRHGLFPIKSNGKSRDGSGSVVGGGVTGDGRYLGDIDKNDLTRCLSGKGILNNNSISNNVSNSHNQVISQGDISVMEKRTASSAAGKINSCGGGTGTNKSSGTRGSSTRAVDAHVVTTFSRIISAYLRDAPPSVTFDDAMVYLCAPFVEVMSTETDAFHALVALLRDHDSLFSPDGLRDATSQFLAMFRVLLPDLYHLFIAEEVDIQAWARSWLRGLLVDQLPRHALLRLWDSYFATEDGIALHPFVCLVFVRHLAPELHDCDDAEHIQALLASLPAMDIDHVVAHAITTRDELHERGVM